MSGAIEKEYTRRPAPDQEKSRRQLPTENEPEDDEEEQQEQEEQDEEQGMNVDTYADVGWGTTSAFVDIGKGWAEGSAAAADGGDVESAVFLCLDPPSYHSFLPRPRPGPAPRAHLFRGGS